MHVGCEAEEWEVGRKGNEGWEPLGTLSGNLPPDAVDAWRKAHAGELEVGTVYGVREPGSGAWTQCFRERSDGTFEGSRLSLAGPGHLTGTAESYGGQHGCTQGPAVGVCTQKTARRGGR